MKVFYSTLQGELVQIRRNGLTGENNVWDERGESEVYARQLSAYAGERYRGNDRNPVVVEFDVDPVSLLPFLGTVRRDRARKPHGITVACPIEPKQITHIYVL